MAIGYPHITSPKKAIFNVWPVDGWRWDGWIDITLQTDRKITLDTFRRWKSVSAAGTQ